MKIVLPKELKFFEDSSASGREKKVPTYNDLSSTPKSRTSIQNGKEIAKEDYKYSNYKCYNIEQDVDVSLSKINTFVDVLNNE
jgi:hypothetical protein